ncbi:alpha/beta hydrolase [Spirulina sp. CCNP1310]|uniref:alpha/beta fold hydrolase n=1 Tax=Spirulina sp. CCNP1310 TaxID=3110249 RepID=UPI002B215E31|nr:alpha/beta hydrolase [Spirulina sp. CCNP1310]MEA5419974.1 alpha/beta hydrolase [Spirulina sp. CCNP1310]
MFISTPPSALIPRQSLPLAPGLDLAYREWGKTGEPVILLHGLADHGGVWSSLAQRLAPHYHCIAPDLRGHGESSKPEDPAAYSFAAMVGDLQALLAALGESSVHLVGHSWGAKVACVWATECPAQVKSLTLVDPFLIQQLPDWVGLTFPLLYRTLPFLQLLGPFLSEEEAIAKAKTLKQYREWTPFQSAVFREGMEAKPDGQWGSKFTIAARNGIFQEVIKVAGLRRSLTLPSLLLQPTAGVNRTAWQLAPYHRYLSSLDHRVIPGHHWAFLSDPERCETEIFTFLEQQRNPGTNF